LLKSKADKVLELETQIGNLESSLATALAEVEVKTTSKEEAENTKAVVEAQLQESQSSLSKLEADILNVNVALSSIQKEV
jgi:chromosome segregation ATPase